MLRREGYMKAFKAIRPQILERDENRCVKCGSTQSLEVHHIDGYKNNEPEFLATLCYLCHGIAPMGKDSFAQWLLLGENGLEALRRKLASRGLQKLTSEQIYAICGALAEFDLDMRVRQLKLARQRIRESGIRCDGRKPFGQQDGEGATLEIMRQLRSEGKRPKLIAEALNANNVLTRYGLKWRGSTIRKILAREWTKTDTSK